MRFVINCPNYCLCNVHHKDEVASLRAISLYSEFHFVLNQLGKRCDNRIVERPSARTIYIGEPQNNRFHLILADIMADELFGNSLSFPIETIGPVNLD